PAGNQLNGAGISATVINYVRATQPAMSGISANALAVQALSNVDLADIAAYIASVITPNNVATPVNTTALIDLNNHITLTNQAWSAFTSIEIVSGPTHGTLGSFNGTQIQYTPNANYLGADSFTYRGLRTTPSSYAGDPQTVTISVNPPTPVINSPTNASGMLGQAFGYQITASNSPTSFIANGLPGGLSVNTAGLISGVPSETGQFSVALSAINAGGIGGATLTLQIDQVAQLITFGAQSSPRTFGVGGTFAILPLATGGASLNAIVYGSNTPGVCTVSATTVTMVAAGICTISADQAGNATYAAANQATQNVTIDPGPQTVTVTINGGGTVTGTGFACPGDCSEAVVQNTVIALTAAANVGFTFSGWSGTCGGSPSGFTYNTNPIVAGCSVIATFVQAANSTTTLGSSLNPSKSGQSVTLTATVSGGVGTPTGTVVFLDGANMITACGVVNLSGGVVQCTTTSLSSGLRSITARYSGNSVYNASTSGALAQTVKGSSLEPIIYLMLD
ncbi:MAG: Ig-like domain repeat protein, partial [Burkholderiales bacterium]|nr:Ig-like domain repeat protein [Burkholderiales bacterium]